MTGPTLQPQKHVYRDYTTYLSAILFSGKLEIQNSSPNSKNHWYLVPRTCFKDQYSVPFYLMSLSLVMQSNYGLFLDDRLQASFTYSNINNVLT